MSILIFIIILSVLVVVHELGHFFAAKYFNVRVDEFGLGYPPRAKKLFIWKNTIFTLNWLPFGGFVKIFGENPTENPEEEVPSEVPNPVGDSLASKNRGIQAAVLVAGVTANFLFAWLLISIGLMAGLPAPAGSGFPVENSALVLTTVIPGSPAAEAGLKSGDTILGLKRGEESAELSPDLASAFIGESALPLGITVGRGDKNFTAEVIPEEGIVPGRPAIGVSMDMIGTVTLAPHKAVWFGLITTGELTWLTAKSLGGFLGQAIIGRADLSQITGPVGIVGMVGDVQELGFAYLLSFTALISLNLAIVNLLPFPALDGGRLLFVMIEAIRRKALSPKVFNALNTVGFALLIILMIIITVRDVGNLL